jgi:hypothetical protein
MDTARPAGASMHQHNTTCTYVAPADVTLPSPLSVPSAEWAKGDTGNGQGGQLARWGSRRANLLPSSLFAVEATHAYTFKWAVWPRLASRMHATPRVTLTALTVVVKRSSPGIGNVAFLPEVRAALAGRTMTRQAQSHTFAAMQLCSRSIERQRALAT